MLAFPIEGFSNYYVTDTGLVYSRNYNNTGRLKQLKQSQVWSGYFIVRFYKNSKTTRFLVHRLVAQAFIPNPKNKPVVNHKNGIKTDNRVENLEWSTHSENQQHKYLVLKQHGSRFGKFGKNNPSSKHLYQIKNGMVVADFWGCKEAQRKTGISFKNISACCLGKRKTAGGYQWTYDSEVLK